MNVNVVETFTSIQGEGGLTGERMHFIRFGGCTVSECFLHPKQTGLCDTNWQQHSKRTVDSLCAEAVIIPGIHWVCITGGEPLAQSEALQELVAALKHHGLLVMIQTSGTIPLPLNLDHALVDYICVSPKTVPQFLRIARGSELKVVYRGQELAEIAEYQEITDFDSYWLQPLWGDLGCNMSATIDAVHALKSGWRLSIQAHKVMGVK